MGRRRPASPAAGAWYLPQIETGLRAGIERFADRMPKFGDRTRAALDEGQPFGITTAKVEDALLRSGDSDAWRRWRSEHQSGDPWQPGGEGVLWTYDSKRALLQPAQPTGDDA